MDLGIKPNYYAYQLRVDTSDNTLVDKWLEKYEVPWYLYGQEEGKLTGKMHIQAIVWFNHQLESKEVMKLRAWFNGKTLKTKQPVAFTKAKRPESLVKYCKKDGKVTTNLTVDEVALVGEWKSKDVLHKEFKDRLYAYAKTIAYKPEKIIYSANDLEDYYMTGEEMEHYTVPTSYDRREFLIKIIEFYRVNKKYPPKRVLDSLLFEYGYMTSEMIYNNYYN